MASLAMPQLNPAVTKVLPLFQSTLGQPERPLPMSLYRVNEYMTHEKILRELWVAWEGINWKSTELMITDLTTRGGEFLDLFPIMNKYRHLVVFACLYIVSNCLVYQGRCNSRIRSQIRRRYRYVR